MASFPLGLSQLPASPYRRNSGPINYCELFGFPAYCFFSGSLLSLWGETAFLTP